MAIVKTVCPIDRTTFRAHAPRSVNVEINGKPLAADYKEFSTGSLGWFLSGKVTIEVNGVPCSAQIGLNLTVVGSKELPQV